jgi:hypothetical protein
MHEIHVSVVSAAEAEDGNAELWSGGRLVAFTLIDDSDLMLRIEPHPDGEPVELGVHSLTAALAEANRLLTTPLIPQ